MGSPKKHKWIFVRRFRRHSFGWRTQPAAKAVRETVSEIRKVARKDPVLAGEGAVLFIEKLSPAIERVDGSSGSMGLAVDNAIEALAPIIGQAPAEKTTRNDWLERLWKAIQEDGLGYLDGLSDHWDVLNQHPEIASHWADRFAPIALQEGRYNMEFEGYFSAVDVYLGSLFTAGRHAEILHALEFGPEDMRGWRVWGVKALAAQGKVDEALAFASQRHDFFSPEFDGPGLCEKILIDAGRDEEAYRRFGIAANWSNSYLNTFRSIAKKYPHKKPEDILRDLVARTSGHEGDWFATAKSLGLYDQAIELANATPCNPLTLTKAAQDFVEKNPPFALEAGLAAIRWFLAGNYYEVMRHDVFVAVRQTMAAAKATGKEEATLGRIRSLMESPEARDAFIKQLVRSAIRG